MINPSQGLKTSVILQFSKDIKASIVVLKILPTSNIPIVEDFDVTICPAKTSESITI